jgi:hypothetical protein
MLDPRTLWLARPEDRYQASPALRRAERAVYPLLLGSAAGRPPVRPRVEQEVLSN